MDKEYTIHDIHYARDIDDNLFKVWPIYIHDAIVTLLPLNSQFNAKGEKFSIISGDLFAYYNLFDQTMNLIHEMVGDDNE